MRLTLEDYLDAIEEEAARLADAPVPVAAVAPGRASPLLEVLRRARTAIEDALDGLGLAGAARTRRLELDTLADDFVRAARDARAGEHAVALARELAVALALCRIDLELAEGEPGALGRELAIDAVAARLESWRTGGPVAAESLGGSIALVCADDPAAFLVEVTRHELRFRTRRGPADAVIVVPAARLFGLVYGRLVPREAEVTGSLVVARAFACLAADGGS